MRLMSCCRSLGVLWLIIITTAIPVWFSHGETQFVDNMGQILMVKCVFSEETHNLPLFQVSIARRRLIKIYIELFASRIHHADEVSHEEKIYKFTPS